MRFFQTKNWYWRIYTPSSDYAQCSAWALWLIAIRFPPWGLGLIRESWGYRVLLFRWQLTFHKKGMIQQ